MPHLGLYFCQLFFPSALALSAIEPGEQLAQLIYARAIGMKGYVIDTFIKQSLLNPLV